MSHTPDEAPKEGRSFPVPEAFQPRAHVRSEAEYAALYKQSLEAPEAFWREQTKELVFRKSWDRFSSWEAPNARFFEGAKLNVTESCLDRHLATEARNRAAIIFEGEPGDTRTLTYFELHREVVRLAAAL